MYKRQLVAYAQALQSAQSQAAAARQEHARGEAETVRGRTAYDQDVTRARQRKAEWEAANGEGTYTLTIEPFHDSGAPVAETHLDVYKGQVDVAAEDHGALVDLDPGHLAGARDILQGQLREDHLSGGRPDIDPNAEDLAAGTWHGLKTRLMTCGRRWFRPCLLYTSRCV